MLSTSAAVSALWKALLRRLWSNFVKACTCFSPFMMSLGGVSSYSMCILPQHRSILSSTRRSARTSSFSSRFSVSANFSFLADSCPDFMALLNSWISKSPSMEESNSCARSPDELLTLRVPGLTGRSLRCRFRRECRWLPSVFDPVLLEDEAEAGRILVFSLVCNPSNLLSASDPSTFC